MIVTQNDYVLGRITRKGAMPLKKTKYSELAQLAEHLTVNQVVAGSSPAFGAKTKNHPIGWFFVLNRLE